MPLTLVPPDSPEGQNDSGRKVGRPKVELNEQTLEGLAQLGCTLLEMATVLGCSESTLKRAPWKGIIARGKASLRVRVRRNIMKMADDKHFGANMALARHYGILSENATEDLPEETHQSVVVIAIPSNGREITPETEKLRAKEMKARDDARAKRLAAGETIVENPEVDDLPEDDGAAPGIDVSLPKQAVRDSWFQDAPVVW